MEWDSGQPHADVPWPQVNTCRHLSPVLIGLYSRSAPEILLAIVGIVANGFQQDSLGPSLIVGSGAFNLPDPPACATEGCITGPPQRKYVDLIRDRLGWLPLETDEDKKWVQVMGPFLIDPDDYVSAFD